MNPFQIRTESGLGGRWPIRWRHGTSVEGGARFWSSGFRVYPILAIAHRDMYVVFKEPRRAFNFLLLFIQKKKRFYSGV